MTFKVNAALSIILALMHQSCAGVIPIENESLHESLHEQHPALATSFMHFHGPVEGPEYEVKVPQDIHHDENNQLLGQEYAKHDYALDYVAHPKYEFSYGVEDHHTGDFHGQKEIRDGNSVTGQYSAKEPGGTIRIVSYRADKDGFHAVVHTSGKNDHSHSAYAGQNHHVQVHSQGNGPLQGYDLQDYVTSYTVR